MEWVRGVLWGRCVPWLMTSRGLTLTSVPVEVEMTGFQL